MEIDEQQIKHTCLKLQISTTQQQQQQEFIFIKGKWFPTHFNLSISDGHNAWICIGSESDVRERASQWDQPVLEYVALAEQYLGFQQPGSVYKFVDAGGGNKRLSWTLEKEGTKLEWRWKCHPSPDSKKTTSEILDFLMDANIRLSEEVVRKSQSFERLKKEADKSLIQSQKFADEKEEFESAMFAKFVAVLNSKKAKLRELGEKLSKLESTGLPLQEEEESTDKTETFDTESDKDEDGEEEEEVTKKLTSASSSRNVPPASKPRRGRKRITRI